MPISGKDVKGAPLRNYFKLRAIKWQITLENPPGTVIFVSDLYAVGSDDDDLKSQYDSINFLTQQAIDPSATATFKNNDAQDAFVLLDKSNLLRWFQGPDNGGTINALYLWQTIAGMAAVDQIIPAVIDTPRYSGWKDDDGVNRDAAPSDKKGAKKVPETPLQILVFLYAQLVAAGRADLAALLLPFVTAIAAGKSPTTVTVKNAFGQKLTFQQVLDMIGAALA